MSHIYTDPQFNLFYFISQAHEETTKTRSKSIFSAAAPAPKPNNLVLWDAPKSTKTVILDAQQLGPNECIINLLFETEYDSESQKMLHTEPHLVLNSQKVEPIDPLDLIIIASINTQTRQTRLWAATKWGFDLRVIAVLPEHAQWHFDAFSRRVRIVYWLDADVNITEIDPLA